MITIMIIILLFQISGDSKSLTLTKTVKLSGAVTDVAYSPNGSYVVTADANRKVTLFDAEYEKANAREWGFHTAKVSRIFESMQQKVSFEV